MAFRCLYGSQHLHIPGISGLVAWPGVPNDCTSRRSGGSRRKTLQKSLSAVAFRRMVSRSVLPSSSYPVIAVSMSSMPASRPVASIPLRGRIRARWHVFAGSSAVIAKALHRLLDPCYVSAFRTTAVARAQDSERGKMPSCSCEL